MDLVNSNKLQLAFQAFLFEVLFVHSLDNHDLGLHYTISQFPLLTGPFIHIFSHHCCRYSNFVQMFHLVFHDGNQQSYYNNSKWHPILPSFQHTLYSRKSWKIRLFPKPVVEIATTSILPTMCFKQFLCSSRLASTFGKSLSAVFVASSNSARWDVESVITAISHQRVYQDLVYQNTILLKILTSIPTPLSPVPVYFSSLSLLRTALHYLNAWNRLA